MLGYSHRRITSGAGHDACNLNTRIPAAMVFVPCKDGISHNELEDATQADCTAGANVLMHTVLALAGCGEHDPEKWVPVFRKDHAQTTPSESFVRGVFVVPRPLAVIFGGWKSRAIPRCGFIATDIAGNTLPWRRRDRDRRPHGAADRN
jgi:hypothetical protein